MRHFISDTYSTLCLHRVTKRVWERVRGRLSFGQPGMYPIPLLKNDELIIYTEYRQDVSYLRSAGCPSEKSLLEKVRSG